MTERPRQNMHIFLGLYQTVQVGRGLSALQSAYGDADNSDDDEDQNDGSAGQDSETDDDDANDDNEDDEDDLDDEDEKRLEEKLQTILEAMKKRQHRKSKSRYPFYNYIQTRSPGLASEQVWWSADTLNLQLKVLLSSSGQFR